MFKPSMSDDNISVARGYNMAFGVLSAHVLQDKAFKVEVIETLMANALPKGKESDDADTRKQAVKSIS